MIYLLIGLFFIITGFRLLLGTGDVFFGAGVYFDFGENRKLIGVLFLIAGMWSIATMKKSFKG